MLDTFGQYLYKKFSLWTGKEAGTHTIQQAQSNISIQGANLWILLWAIVICSIGLNMNSMTIVIGAMLISPLMGPIIGIGVGLAIYDMDMVRRGLRNFLVACVLAIVVSGLYFLITPVQEITNEILLRTSPTVWDILIAGAGWLVGAIALTRKEKWFTVIPGVAIATSLMPPLAVSGFWFIQGDWFIGMKALYLLAINCIYIIGATFLVARLLRLPKKEYPDVVKRREVKFVVTGLIIIAAIPALLLTSDLIYNQRLEQQFQKYADSVMTTYSVQILKKSINTDKKELNLRIVWHYLSQSEQEALKSHLSEQLLLEGYKLNLRQGIDADPELWTDLVQPLIQEAIELQETHTITMIQQSLKDFALKVFQPERVLQEAQALDESIIRIGFAYGSGEVWLWSTDRIFSLVFETSRPISLSKKSSLESWIRSRIQQPELAIVWEVLYGEDGE